jgi:hypothetical protein
MLSADITSFPAYKNDSSDVVAQPDNAAVASNTAAITARDIPLIELRFMVDSSFASVYRSNHLLRRD